MALDAYRKKRDFSTTPEPKGKRGARPGYSFVVQKHAARRLHYDFRLELDGVLKSWAVTRGPSLITGDKRLAIQVEDHPLEYGNFEGTIPKGEYGGGTVIVWDRGTWKPHKDPRNSYAKGHLEFELVGKKLKGRWHLVRLSKRNRERQEPWLLIKSDDQYATDKGDGDILERSPKSVKTGRSIEQVASELPGWSSKTGRIDRPSATDAVYKTRAAKKSPMPSFVEPALATLSIKAPTGRAWIHEIKYDGYRLQAHIEAGRVKLLTRTGLDWTRRFGRLILEALKSLPIGRAIIDGELVVESSAGVSDFSQLQADLSEGRSDRMRFYAFDIVYGEDRDLRRVALLDRKAVLERLLPTDSDVLKYSVHFEEDGDLILRHACRLSLEGVISKRKDAGYRSGRQKDWLKSKCSERQEFVIGGYVPSTTSRNAIGSLVLGVFEDKKFQYVGRVGTGYSATVAADLYKRLEKLRIDKSAFGQRIPRHDARQVRFVRPSLVAEVEVRGWTADKILRHASFRGIREDKVATDVVLESSSTRITASKSAYRLTHPDRLYWPDDGVTKEGLADYYADVWRFMGPLIVDRPLALLRCPQGIGDQCFFQKHLWEGVGKSVVPVFDPRDDKQALISIHDFEGMIALVQAGALEIHPWGIRARDFERPDWITMDLDPHESVPWERVIDAAQEVRDRLDKVGLSAFLKTSGGKGLHVVSPLKPKADWAQVKRFTQELAESMASDSPDDYVATITKSKRRGKILIDYLRNGRGATAVAAYSTRARPGAAVSMPLHWNELNPQIGPAYFNVENAATRLNSRHSDPWAEFFGSAVPLPLGKTRRARSG